MRVLHACIKKNMVQYMRLHALFAHCEWRKCNTNPRWRPIAEVEGTCCIFHTRRVRNAVLASCIEMYHFSVDVGICDLRTIAIIFILQTSRVYCNRCWLCFITRVNIITNDSEMVCTRPYGKNSQRGGEDPFSYAV